MSPEFLINVTQASICVCDVIFLELLESTLYFVAWLHGGKTENVGSLYFIFSVSFTKEKKIEKKIMVYWNPLMKFLSSEFLDAIFCFHEWKSIQVKPNTIDSCASEKKCGNSSLIISKMEIKQWLSLMLTDIFSNHRFLIWLYVQLVN